MSNKIHLGIIIVLSIILCAFLATRPKFVVKDAQAVQNSSSEKEEGHEDDGHNDDDESHESKLSPAAQSAIANLKAKLAANTNITSKNILLDSLAGIFMKESAFDSAGFYLEKIALSKSNVDTWLNAGDAYFQAYNMALSPEKTKNALEKSRLCYNKVLALESTNLHAKTNMAMTFVKTDSPMKAIGMLREVLDTNPNYVPAIMSLGGLSMQSNQFDKAVQRFNYVLKIDPSNLNAKLGLAYSLVEVNKKEEAKKIFTDLLNQNIDPVIKDEITKTLNSLK